jgi:hypothetical protein
MFRRTADSKKREGLSRTFSYVLCLALISLVSPFLYQLIKCTHTLPKVRIGVGTVPDVNVAITNPVGHAPVGDGAPSNSTKTEAVPSLGTIPNVPCPSPFTHTTVPAGNAGWGTPTGSPA